MTNTDETYAAPRSIRIERQGEEPFDIVIHPHTKYSFGRDRSNTVTFANDTISRNHGLLACDANGRWMYRDQRSSNGSFLSSKPSNGSEVEEAEKLSAGRSYLVAAGQSIVLGNRAARITFLDEVIASTAERSATKSPASAAFEESIRVNARHRMPLFILGATGSGKTWAARRIHELSRVPGNFVLVDCGALPREHNSLRSELLGHVRGAFSDAKEARLGRLMHADGGTLFLDEVESLAPEGQALLLNLIDGTGDFAPLGQAANVEVKIPRFRLISASKVPLRKSDLREDLCNRLARGGVINVPTLEQRRADIPVLVREIACAMKKELQLDAHFEPAAIKELQSASWPGHVRELEGVVRTLVELEKAREVDDSPVQTGQFQIVNGELMPSHLIINAAAVLDHLEQRRHALGEEQIATPQPVVSRSTGSAFAAKRPRDYTREEIESVLSTYSGNITRTAEALGMVPNTLKRLLTQHGISRVGR